MSEYLATAAADVKLWSVPASSERKYTAACSFTPHHITDVADVAWAHDGSQIAVAAKDSVTVHDLKGNIVETVPSSADFLRTDEIKSVGFLQKSRYLTFCGTDKLIRVWDRTESKFTKTFSRHSMFGSQL
ncbi:hypothetical protein BKA69DRAFT_196818 [Paraphysoderma sedebokerense]|nr:hypothetical protein BKA69DRAFT_196818 [Paraphysoderma sedebokerense]